MEITHTTKNLRIAPRKLRLVADKLRHEEALKALALSALLPQKGAALFAKSLKSAIQVAKDNNLDERTLVIQRSWCDEGRSLKRVVPHSRGRMSRIMKKYSHLSLVLAGEPQTRGRKKASQTAESPVPETAVTPEEN